MITNGNIEKVESTSLITTSNELLVKAQWPTLSINEQRLVLYMLALVKKGDEDFKKYQIQIKELNKILGSNNNASYNRFDEATNGLMTKIIRWFDPEYQDLNKVTWCAQARLAKGRGHVELSFHPDLKPFLLALKGNFTQYELRAVIRLKNHYSLRLYQLLKYHQGMARVDNREAALVDVEWLKEFLGVTSGGGYDHFGHFKNRILVPAQQDILEKTDIKFNYQKVKEGKKVTSIRFFWAVNPKYNQLELPIFSEEQEDIIEKGEKPPIQKKDAIDQYEEQVIKRLLDFGLNHQTIREVLINNTPEGVQDTLNYIERAYLYPGKGHPPIKDLRAYIATCLSLPKGSVTRKPKLQIEREKQIDAARIKEEQEARKKEEFEKIEAISQEYGSRHREAMENRIKEIVSEKGMKWGTIYEEYLKQAPSYILSHYKKITSSDGIKKIPYTRDQAIVKDTMIKVDFFRYLQKTFLTEEEIDFHVFVKKTAPVEDYEKLQSRFREDEIKEE